MVPPSNRRGGFSRRAQYSVFTGYLLAALGALVGAILLIVSLIHPAAFSGLRGFASDLGAPIGKAGAAGRVGGQKTVDSVSGFIRMGTQNARLREENEIARIRLAEADALAQENKRLKALLKVDEGELEPVTRARLIGSTASSTRRFAYLSAGSSDGVKPGMPVRSPRGLVGRILETGSSSSRVLLLTDTESLVPVRRAKDNVVAFAEGRADGTLRLRLVNLGINPLRKGDVFVTSGAGGLFQPGTAVAVVTKVNRDGAIANLLSDPASTDYVIVEPIWQPEAHALATGNPRAPLEGGEAATNAADGETPSQTGQD